MNPPLHVTNTCSHLGHFLFIGINIMFIYKKFRMVAGVKADAMVMLYANPRYFGRSLIYAFVRFGKQIFFSIICAEHAVCS